MSHTVEGFIFRAEECVRLANLTKDGMIQREILTLRQTFLKTAERLRELKGGSSHTGAAQSQDPKAR